MRLCVCVCVCVLFSLFSLFYIILIVKNNEVESSRITIHNSLSLFLMNCSLSLSLY